MNTFTAIRLSGRLYPTYPIFVTRCGCFHNHFYSLTKFYFRLTYYHVASIQQYKK